MSTNGRMRSWEYLDDPWRRLTWIVPTSVLLWAGMLVAFAAVLQRIPPTPPELPPADVRFVELPPTAASAAAAAPAHHPAPARPKPKVVPVRPRHHYVPIRRAPVAKRRITRPAPPAPTHVATNTHAPASSAKESSTRSASKSVQRLGIGGVGSNSGGVRAIYAPTPVIPDDLRNQMIRTVAVAHFEVARNGNVEVSLTRPTNIPELNQVLLDTLKQWRFFPAMKNGVAINSQFNVRIPISVQ